MLTRNCGPLSEASIRAQLLQMLWSARGDSDTLLLEEVGLLHGAYRADVVALGQALSAYEIKSEADTLARLSHQVRAYNAVFDNVSIVLTASHLAGALEIVPEWWGVILASNRNGETSLMSLRDPEVNPAPDAHALASLLWKDEALGILAEADHTSEAMKGTKRAAYEALSASFTWQELRQKVTDTLRVRTDWLTAYTPL
jgi:hypothetical protein